MTLNASGPISLGGSTVGQSINLELGQSATANTSLNATNVRTLLQVPSGTISLSNAYGKSNATAFIVSLGFQATGNPSVNTAPIRGYGWAASPSGVTAWKMGAYNYVGYMSADGTTFTSVNVSTGGTRTCFFPPMINKYTAGSLFPMLVQESSKMMNYGSSNGYRPSLSVLYGCGGSASGAPLAFHIDSSGNVSWVQNVNPDKFGAYLVIGRNSISGTVVGTYAYRITAYSDIAGDSPRRIFQRSDGSYLFAWGTTDYLYYRTFNSSANTPLSQRSMYKISNGVCLGIDMDSSNNLYAYFQNGNVFKINSSDTVVAGYNYSVVSPAYASSLGRPTTFGISVYNDVLYIASNGENADGYYLNIIAVNCTNMATVLWNRKFYFNNNQIRPMSTFASDYGGGQANGITATSAGLYVAFTVGTGTQGEVMCLNLPLTAGVSNQTTTVAFKGGGSIDMTVTTPSNTTTSITLGGTNSLTTGVMTDFPNNTTTALSSALYSPGIGGTKTNVTT